MNTQHFCEGNDQNDQLNNPDYQSTIKQLKTIWNYHKLNNKLVKNVKSTAEMTQLLKAVSEYNLSIK